jgi:hypothetical protein
MLEQPRRPAADGVTLSWLQKSCNALRHAIAKGFAPNKHLWRELISSEVPHDCPELGFDVETQAMVHPPDATTLVLEEMAPFAVPVVQQQIEGGNAAQLDIIAGLSQQREVVLREVGVDKSL